MPGDFAEPDWDAPLDPRPIVDAIPVDARIKGMFPGAIAEEARSRGMVLPGARERYLSFEDIPSREYTAMLAEAARVFFPALTLRRALRKLGRATHDVFARSIVGAVVMSTGDDLPGAIAAAAKAYAITTPPAHVAVAESAPGRIVVSLSNVYNFLDSHHVGVLESVARAHGLRVTPRVRLESMFVGEIELTW